MLTSPSSVSPGRETQVLVELAAFRFLTQRHLEDVLFGSSTVSPLSRQVIVRRVLTRLKAHGLVQETPRLTGGVPGAARLAYFLTAAGYRRARALDPGLPAGRPGIRSTTLLGHGLMCGDVALAFRHAARAHLGHALVEWNCDWAAAERLGSTVVVPDAHFVYRSEDATLDAFLEVDLGTEGSRVFARKVDRYLQLHRSGDWRRHLPVWPVILTVTPNATRAALLRRATATVLGAQYDREAITQVTAFTFSTIEDVLGTSGPLGPIWRHAGGPDRAPLFDPVPGDDGSLAT
jgi:hypothetical protein